jgi:hypothetical protein
MLRLAMTIEYIIYCDESESRGKHFSNFYGGALVSSEHIEEVRAILGAKKQALNLFGEVKWSKITVNYHKKYIELTDCFFDLVAAGKVKIRIMFTQNIFRVRKPLSRDQMDNQYAILYYYFIRHAFGLVHCPQRFGGSKVRVYLDEMPLSASQFGTFQNYVTRLSGRSEFRNKGIRFLKEDVTQVVSHDHDILQCLDIVLGAMNFRLNDKHLERPPGASRRGAKTLARLKVYQQINQRIRQIYPNFNIGITTGYHGDEANRWRHPYRHWNFRSKNSVMMPGSKKDKKKAP